MGKVTSTPAASGKAVSAKPESVVSAYLAYSKFIRADVKRSLPGDASGADIMRAIGSRWKSLSKEEKKPFVNQRNAWLFSQGRTPKNLGGASRGLPAGWVKDVIGGKKVFVHLASNVVTMKKPMDRDALTNKSTGIKRPLSAYGSFVQTNFKKYGSLKEVAVAWKSLSDSKKDTYKAAADASKADYQTKVLAA
jgi:hypothetical protein